MEFLYHSQESPIKDKSDKIYQSVTPTDFERDDDQSSSFSPSEAWNNISYPRHSTPKGSPVNERPTSYSLGQSLLFSYKPDILSPPTLKTNNSTDSLTKVDLSIPFETYLQNLGDSLRKSHKGKLLNTTPSPEAKRIGFQPLKSYYTNPMARYQSPYFRYWESKTSSPYPGAFGESLSHPAFRQADGLTSSKSVAQDKTQVGKKYKCDVCDKTFSRSNTLVTHKRIHTGEKPFKCEICDRAFRQPGNLTRHRLTHTSIKPYVCGTCNKAFNRASNLQTHLRIHNKGAEYAMPYPHM